MCIFRFQRDIVDVVLVLFLARTIGSGIKRGEVLLAFFFSIAESAVGKRDATTATGCCLKIRCLDTTCIKSNAV